MKRSKENSQKSQPKRRFIFGHQTQVFVENSYLVHLHHRAQQQTQNTSDSFQNPQRVRAFHQCFVYVEWNFAGFFLFFLFPTPPLAMVEIDFVGVGAGSIEVSFTFKMAETCLVFSAEKTTFDPQSKGCLIVGQPRHLQAVSYDNFAGKLSRRVDAAVWKCFISSI